MEAIEWKNLGFMGYDNYSVSSDGQVRNDRSGKVLKLHYLKGKNRYMCAIYNDFGQKGFLVHRLVAMAFIHNPDNLPQVNHRDENPANKSKEKGVIPYKQKRGKLIIPRFYSVQSIFRFLCE